MKPVLALSAFFLLCLVLGGVAWAGEAVCPEEGIANFENAGQVLAVDGQGRGYIVQRASLREPQAAPPNNPVPALASIPAALRLEGVISSSGRALAIIDGGFYREGDCVSGFLITDIQRDRVTLEKGGRKASLVIK